MENLLPDLVGIAPLADAAQIGRPVSANTGDAMATLASVGMKQKRAMIAVFRPGCMCHGMTNGNEYSD